MSAHGDRGLQPEPTSDGFGWVLWAIGGALLVLVVALVQGNSPEQKQKQLARKAIELCWADQAKRSNTAGSARVIAGACEKLESDYVERYHAKP